MAGTVVRLRPKRHDVVAEALQLMLELPLGLQQSSLNDLAEALGRYEPCPRWSYVMLNPDQLRTVLKLINGCPHPALTLRVWSALVIYVRMETGEIMAGRTRLAEDAATTPQEVSRALVRLTDMGVLIRLRPGRYAINPHVGWAGSLAKRETTAKTFPQLTLVPPAE